MGIGDWVLLAAACLMAVPFVVLTVETIAALLPARRKAPADGRPACVVIIPAHDEAVDVAEAIHGVREQLTPGDRILVVADNCSDETAAIARAEGVEVVERHDPERRGKGYALDFGINALAANPPAVVAVVDADCDLAPGALDLVVRQAVATNRPAQGIYLIGTGKETDPRRRLSAFAVLLKNQVRPQGLHRLGLPCLLTGTGMAIPWPVLRSVNLGGSIVEDTKLGVDLALAGHPPKLCPQAWLCGASAPDRKSAVRQRTRWEHGHVQMIMTHAPRLWLAGLMRGRPGLIGLGFELAVPPLSLLVALWIVLLAVSAGWWHWADGSVIPMIVHLSAGVMAAFVAFAAWLKYGRIMLPFSALVMAPIYVLWKLPIYLKLLFAREKRWLRTERTREKNPW